MGDALDASEDVACTPPTAALRGVVGEVAGEPTRGVDAQVLGAAGALAHGAYGFHPTARRGGRRLRCVPSAGARYSADLLILHSRAVYWYRPDGTCLRVPGAVGFSGHPGLVVCSTPQRLEAKYGDRCFPSAILDVGYLLASLRWESDERGVALGGGSAPVNGRGVLLPSGEVTIPLVGVPVDVSDATDASDASVALRGVQSVGEDTSADPPWGVAGRGVLACQCSAPVRLATGGRPDRAARRRRRSIVGPVRGVPEHLLPELTGVLSRWVSWWHDYTTGADPCGVPTVWLCAPAPMGVWTAGPGGQWGRVSDADVVAHLAHRAGPQPAVGSASAVLVFSVPYARDLSGQQVRDALLDSGQAAALFAVWAASVGLGCCPLSGWMSGTTVRVERQERMLLDAERILHAVAVGMGWSADD